MSHPDTTVAAWREPPKPLLGAVRVPNPLNKLYKDQPVCDGWRLTRSLDDLLLPAEDLVVADTEGAIEVALHERYPAPHPELTRIVVRPVDHRGNSIRNLAFGAFCLPIVRTQTINFGRVQENELQRVERLAAEFGPLLISYAERQRLLYAIGYHESTLIGNTLLGGRHDRMGYDLIRSDAKRAAARVRGQQTRKRNQNAKYAHANKLAQIRAVHSNIRERVRDAVLDTFGELRHSFYFHALPQLVDLLPVGEKFCGKRFYRKVEGWDTFLETWRGWDRELVQQALDLPPDQVAWLDREVAAMKRRKRPKAQPAPPEVPA